MAVYQLLDEIDGIDESNATPSLAYPADGYIRVRNGKARVYTAGGQYVGSTTDALPVPSGFYLVATDAGSRKVYVKY